MDINGNQNHLMYSFIRPLGKDPKVKPGPKDIPGYEPSLMYSFVRPFDEDPKVKPAPKDIPGYEPSLMYSFVTKDFPNIEDIDIPDDNDSKIVLMYSYVIELPFLKKPEGKSEEPFAPFKPQDKFQIFKELIEKFLEKLQNNNTTTEQ